MSRSSSFLNLAVRAALMCGVIVAACAEPYVPRSALPTLDDPVGDDFVAVTAGRDHSCALTSDGAAWCWGSNEAGQLGVPAGTSTCPREDRRIPCERRPVAVAGGLAFRAISAGQLHTCALTFEGSVYCWGDNVRGPLGDPSVRIASAPVRVLSQDVFTAVAAGGFHTCALRTDGVAFCWGANDEGQLGLSNVGSGSPVPAAVVTSQRFVEIAAGERRTCARAADGDVFCWGATWISRQNGVDITRPEGSPVRVAQSPAFRALAVGATSTCAISTDNLGYCWEANAAGTLGDGTTRGSVAPTPVATSDQLVAVSVGAAHACGIAATGRAYCWGANGAGQLGVSPALTGTRCSGDIACSVRPIPVSGWRLYRDLSAGQGNHACALALSGSIYCWGAGSLGQRGDGRLSNDWAPVRVRRPDYAAM